MLLPIPFQNLHKILLHVDIDRAVAGEGAAAFSKVTDRQELVIEFIKGRQFLFRDFIHYRITTLSILETVYNQEEPRSASIPITLITLRFYPPPPHPPEAI